MSTTTSLKNVISEKIGDDFFVIVSNREPYIHKWCEGKVVVDKPASGLVTAMDPMLRATQGMWVALGSGNADRHVADEQGRIMVPPGDELYTLKRVWLNKDLEKGYYFGFSNGSLWPLCHISFTPPNFHAQDWEAYRRVNQIFADAILEELGDRKAFIWVQDYHFALLPSLLKEKRPDLTVAQFWHIPWPNPEVFRICPWVKEILNGMLGNDLLGFHVQLHCENFLNTVDQFLEVRIDRERSIIYHDGGIATKVNDFPISVDVDMIEKDVKQDFSHNDGVQSALRALPKKHDIIAMGVDRIDYTKGLPHRLRAIDRFLEKYPHMQQKFVYVQIGAISRIHIGIYKELNAEIQQLVEDINWKYSTDDWQPIVLLTRNLTYPEVLFFYKMANICIVSSLHDGMNLVAKEYVASNMENDGVLMLSRFTGATRELDNHAVIINPYDTEGFADMLDYAVTMPKEERMERMRRMREIISENNIYKWGEDFISELARLA